MTPTTMSHRLLSCQLFSVFIASSRLTESQHINHLVDVKRILKRFCLGSENYCEDGCFCRYTHTSFSPVFYEISLQVKHPKPTCCFFEMSNKQGRDYYDDLGIPRTANQVPESPYYTYKYSSSVLLSKNFSNPNDF
jgi:hypothetical protein